MVYKEGGSDRIEHRVDTLVVGQLGDGFAGADTCDHSRARDLCALNCHASNTAGCRRHKHRFTWHDPRERYNHAPGVETTHCAAAASRNCSCESSSTTASSGTRTSSA